MVLPQKCRECIRWGNRKLLLCGVAFCRMMQDEGSTTTWEERVLRAAERRADLGEEGDEYLFRMQGGPYPRGHRLCLNLIPLVPTGSYLVRADGMSIPNHPEGWLANLWSCSFRVPRLPWVTHTDFTNLICDTYRSGKRLQFGNEERGLAEEIYEHRLPDGDLNPSLLNILADMLTDRGNHPRTIENIRANRRRFRGFWAVDAILGKKWD